MQAGVRCCLQARGIAGTFRTSEGSLPVDHLPPPGRREGEASGEQRGAAELQRRRMDLEDRREQLSFGMLNYGDWYWASNDSWGNLEYDMPRCFFAQYLRSGDRRFFDRAEIKDALCYLRLVTNPNDDVAFERASSMPPKGMGAKTMSQIRTFAKEHNVSLLSAAFSMLQNQELKARASASTGGFLKLIEKIKTSINLIIISFHSILNI